MSREFNSCVYPYPTWLKLEIGRAVIDLSHFTILFDLLQLSKMDVWNFHRNWSSRTDATTDYWDIAACPNEGSLQLTYVTLASK